MNDEQPPVDPKQSLDKPARKQVPGPVTHDSISEQTGAVNIWSGRQLGPGGGRGAPRDSRQKASQYRCRPILDTGRTKGSQGNVNTFCLFFAKGMCYQGPNCPYLHRLPTSADEAAMTRNISMDIFGRDKMPAGLENKKGAGSYERDMTTLYVNYGGAGHYAVPQLRHLLLQNFGEFGPVRRIHIVPAKTIAFIKYHWRVSAEFAREALDQQQLTGSTLNEVLSVRWAYDDPNPVAVVGRKRAALDAVETAAMSAWDALPAEEKRARIAMAQAARAQRISAVAAAMPAAMLAAGGGEGSNHGDSIGAWGPGSDWEDEVGMGQQHAAYAGAGGEAAAQQQQQSWVDASGSAQPEADGTPWQASDYDIEQQHVQTVSAAGDHSAHEAAQPSSWFQGWQQRHKPATFADTLAGNAAVSAAQHQDVQQSAGAGDAGAGLGLLAGYGSDTESEQEAGDDAADLQVQQQQQAGGQQQQEEAGGQQQQRQADSQQQQHDAAGVHQQVDTQQQQLPDDAPGQQRLQLQQQDQEQ